VEVHCDEGVAIHIGPEPCVHARERYKKFARALKSLIRQKARIGCGRGAGEIDSVKANNRSHCIALLGGRMPHDKPSKGIIRIPSPRDPKTSDEPPRLQRVPMRSLEELTPVARKVALNLGLMRRFRDVMGSDDEDRARAMVDEVRNFARTFDPTITYPEGATVSVILMKMTRDQRGETENG
jgi:hypothetical protein